MDYFTRERIGAATGVASVITLGVANALTPTYPKPEATADVIKSFVAQHRTDMLWQTFLFGVAALFGLWFLGSLRSTLRRAEGGAGRVSAVAFGGGIATWLFTGLATVFFGTAAYYAASTDASLVALVYHLSMMTAVPTAFALGTLIAATNVVAFRTRVLPLWLIGLGGLAFVATIASAASVFVKTGTFAVGGRGMYVTLFGGALIWTLATSVTLTMKLGQRAESNVARRRISDIAERAGETFVERRQRASDG
jgi:hypothetical protein